MKKPIQNEKLSTGAEEFADFMIEFSNESDRAAVVLGAARLDYFLEMILKKFLMPCSGNNDDLFDFDRPISSFSAKINLVTRLGLINSDFSRCLHLIRKIRNAFSHEGPGMTLAAGPHHDQVKELAIIFKAFPLFEQMKELFPTKVSGTRGDFIFVLAILVVRLEGLFDNVKPFRSGEALEPIPETFEKFNSLDEARKAGYMTQSTLDKEGTV